MVDGRFEDASEIRYMPLNMLDATCQRNPRHPYLINRVKLGDTAGGYVIPLP
jgi:hypothetical protein